MSPRSGVSCVWESLSVERADEGFPPWSSHCCLRSVTQLGCFAQCARRRLVSQRAHTFFPLAFSPLLRLVPFPCLGSPSIEAQRCETASRSHSGHTAQAQAHTEREASGLQMADGSAPDHTGGHRPTASAKFQSPDRCAAPAARRAGQRSVTGERLVQSTYAGMSCSGCDRPLGDVCGFLRQGQGLSITAFAVWTWPASVWAQEAAAQEAAAQETAKPSAPTADAPRASKRYF
jgi:hypothetical protein